ncbi:TIGR03960 family B12-binding radical SAM protein [Clostridium aminobutyricum]|uniref:TIGR03960 family B12-binding radical SAM protein n=1 Tax=Clostridium aminobutyricum TaxID=33953 RepID=A0A939D7M4_CLOAM|nr:TIGR03960 family B12-binding radical SAM protein [Clostridium aminobutyricum]MBN7772550.1 TIGR03960 family B12-binding radical SAM protein [Clostridium aminobutyricum]
MSLNLNLDNILKRVEKPARYIGGELNSVSKEPQETTTRFCFAFPDTYEIGMSYLGMQILYHILNKEEHIFCERAYCPGLDMEAILREEHIPLFTLESKTPIKEMDFVGFTLQYELSFTNILNILDLSGIPFLREERGDAFPIVIAGGPCAFNPEPLADIVDIFLIGDGEEILVTLFNEYQASKGAGETREEFYKRVVKLQGVYIPKFYEPMYNEENGQIERIEKLYDDAPDRVLRCIISDINAVDFPTNPIVPFIETVHDRSVVETFRGCTRGCRFCQAGMIYRPVRERKMELIEELARKQLENTGHEELSLLSLSTSDYSRFEELAMNLMSMCKNNNVSLSLPSLRLDSFSFKVLEQIQGYKKSGLTFAPEAGSQRLRDVINKCITEENIYSAVEQALELGWKNIKLYFMTGLPTENVEDLDGIYDIAYNIIELNRKINAKSGRFNVTVSASNFVPKAHTPFQWMAQDSAQQFSEKHKYLKDKLRTIKGVTFNYHGTDTSVLEAVFARGDRRVGKVIIKAFELGCKFDGWTEHFNYPAWKQAFEETGVNPDFYTTRERSYEEVLPWDIIDSGISKDFLIRENEKARKEETTQDCRNGCVGCGMNNNVKCEMEGING